MFEYIRKNLGKSITTAGLIGVILSNPNLSERLKKAEELEHKMLEGIHYETLKKEYQGLVSSIEFIEERRNYEVKEDFNNLAYVILFVGFGIFCYDRTKIKKKV